ncbi:MULTISPECIES: DUF4252 domain-containing protein [Maribellus]|uniref:DUF4252 domain-containing protein n=1 Tax=Maribellus comscasis TaxID=2681766 RepID=A0A6I6JRF1_9BACT|nr:MULTISPECIES: DUF4252 domain-containing protein [Maribellus]MCG6186808.1 DUF4252 domain-containing protein [Maribellus maritimus]QGY45595.1 DUF4252 domain-containing protein [Maribellus comscasis]
MKKLILLIAVVLPMAVLAQKSPVDKLFEKYANQKGFTTVSISGKLLSFAAQFDTGDEATKDLLASLRGVRVLSVEDDELNKNIDFYAELERDGFFKDKDFEVLMEVTEDDEVVRFLAKDAGNGKISDLLLVVGGDDNALISISGIIDPENIGKITRSLDVDLGDIDVDIKK